MGIPARKANTRSSRTASGWSAVPRWARCRVPERHFWPAGGHCPAAEPAAPRLASRGCRRVGSAAARTGVWEDPPTADRRVLVPHCALGGRGTEIGVSASSGPSGGRRPPAPPWPQKEGVERYYDSFPDRFSQPGGLTTYKGVAASRSLLLVTSTCMPPQPEARRCLLSATPHGPTSRSHERTRYLPNPRSHRRLQAICRSDAMNDGWRRCDGWQLLRTALTSSGRDRGFWRAGG